MKFIKNDIPASIVVFFVALPLCLGIALASGAQPFAGLIAGIIGGIVVGAISKSAIGVSGPAAGLAAIVLTAIGSLGYESFLVAVVLGGVIQLLFGVLKAGIIGYYFPSSVIKGMLSGIGIIIILKQIPHFFGYDASPEGDFAFSQMDGQNTFSELFHMVSYINTSATVIAVIALAILLLWDKVLGNKAKVFQLVQGPLVAVVLGIVFYNLTKGVDGFTLADKHLVNVPIATDISSFLGQFSFPDFSALAIREVWITGFTIALVASLETLLCVEATDKIDAEQRVTPTNRELFAQGIGNICSGMIGGLPITQVIVRSSANVQAGGKTKLSAIIHGFLLLISVILIPSILNMIPLSVLAAILFIVGFKLAKPSVFIEVLKMGWKQYIPFLVTVIGIVFTDLLVGISLGLLCGIVVILIKNYQNSHFLHIEDNSSDQPKIKMTLAEEVTFINKGAILKELTALPEHTELTFDVRKTRFLDADIIEILDNFAIKAKRKNINITLLSLRGVVTNPESYAQFFKSKLPV